MGSEKGVINTVPEKPLQSGQSFSLFDDPRWKNAREAMGEEEVEKYRKIGESFNSIDYETGESAEIPIPKPAQDSLAYILSGLRSGLSEDDLTDDEIKVLNEYLGDHWREVAGLVYSEESSQK